MFNGAIKLISHPKTIIQVKLYIYGIQQALPSKKPHANQPFNSSG